MPSRLFDASLHGALLRQLAIAEDLCGDYFKLNAFDLQSAPYDVATAEELFAEGLNAPPEASRLAEIRRCDLTREERSARDRRRTHYRILLWDPHILAACEQGVPAEPLLLYLLTHELVHVVRFHKQLALFDADGFDHGREEEHVHDLTEKLLHKVPDPQLKTLLVQLPAIGECLARVADSTR